LTHTSRHPRFEINEIMKLVALIVSMMLSAAAACAEDAAPYPVTDCGKFTVQMDLNKCAEDNLQSADTALNKVYQQLMAEQDAASRERLKDAERAWIAYRDRECAFETGPREAGGSMWPSLISGCLEEKTAAHIRELSAMRGCTAGVTDCNPH
jgi:uncharacterized protein YecT (DUF1311 family)